MVEDVISAWGDANSGQSSTPASMDVEAWVEQVDRGGQEHPVVTARFRNTAAVPLAFSETFGFGSYAWIGIRVRSAAGRAIPYPADIDRFSRPPYRCLRPGEELIWRVDLLEWRVVVGGEAKGDSYTFDLSPGRYEVQVQYSGGGASGRLGRCRPFRGVARSDWVPFEVRP